MRRYSYSYGRSPGVAGVVGLLALLLFSGLLISLIVMAFFSLIAAIPLYFLWNWLMPDIFDLPTISYWQAWGIAWLSAILFKSGGTSSTSSKND